MKFFFKIILILIFVVKFNEAKADTLIQSLQSAYLNNSKLNAERANMRASIEEKREAISEFLPNVRVAQELGSYRGCLGIAPCFLRGVS